MEIVRALGDQLESQWRDLNYDDREFPRLAERTFLEAALHERVTADGLVDWALSVDRLPKQLNLDSNFGEPPLTLYTAKGFYIEALFWLEGTTSVHGHGFSGAFFLLAGSSIHSQYRFEVKQRISWRTLIGRLELESVELLRAGACHQIRSRAVGDELVHSLFHLDRPSVTLVARTYSEPDAQPQYQYSPPSLAHAAFYGEEHQKRTLQLLDMLAALDKGRYQRGLEQVLARADYMTSLLALEAAARVHLDSLDELGPSLEIVRSRFGDLAEPLPAALADARRIAELTSLRKLARSRDHRFFLALLLNVPTRADLLRLVEMQVRNVDPVTTVMRWLRELTAGPAEADNILGIDFDETSLVVMRFLIEGRTFEQIEEHFARTFGADEIERQVDRLRALVDDLRGIERLRPLFQ